jgi:hypothetical protein
MTLLLPLGVMVAGMVLSQVLVRILPILGLAGLAIELVGGLWMLALTITMALEVKWVTQNQAFVWWPLLVPFYNIYWLCVLLPAEVTRAKQRLGVRQPTRPVVLYFFLSLYALASDVNDLVR